MADDSDNLNFTLNLDNADFLKKILSSQDAVSGLGSGDSLKGLTDGLLKAGVVVGTLAAAFAAAKTAIGLVFDAESLKQTNVQFQNLAQNAGLIGSDLKAGLTEASGGLIDTNDLLKAGSQAIEELGYAAKDIPGIMTIARQATAVFGGDLVSNFEQINQAIATGNTRLLRHMGLAVDSKKALDDYAKSVGTTADNLSDYGKKQALMNAVLEEGGKRFKGVNPDLAEATNLWTQIKVSLTEIKDIAVIAFDKLIGPTVIAGFKTVNGWLRQTLENLKLLTMSKEEMKKGIDEDILGPKTTGQKMGPAPSSINTEKVEQDKVEAIKKAEDDLKTYLDDLHKKSEQSDFENIKTMEQLEVMSKVRLKELNEKTEKEKADVKKKFQDAGIHDEQALQRVYQAIDEKAAQDNEKRLKEEADKKKKILEDEFTHAKTLSAAVAAYEAEKTNEGVKNSLTAAQVIEKAHDSIGGHAKQAFLQMGAGSKQAGQAMKEALLGPIADIAEAQGETMMLASIFPPNPAAFAGGAALVALAGFLRSQAGGGAAGFGAVGAGGPGAGGQVSNFPAAVAPTTAPNINTGAGNTQLVVQGSIFDSDATATRLMDLMRQANDQQDYRLTQIGSVD